MSGDSSGHFAHWHEERDEAGILWLCLDKADGSANVLSEPVLLEFDRIVAAAEAAPPAGLVIWSGKANGFVMGADINEFTAIETAAQARDLIGTVQRLFSRLEALPCPTVAVLNGFALGGGLELAMACRYRVALQAATPVIGLPEVQLGLHPGFGGTVRAVRIAGVRAAMQLMLTGQPIRVDKALAQGFVDRVVADDEWREVVRELVASGRPKRAAAFVDRLLNRMPFRPLVGRMLRKQVAARARRDHYPAPYAMIDLWVRHGASEAGYDAEARSFAELMVGATSRNLVRIFFLQNRLKNQGGRPDRKIERVHVVGAGVMGGDIAAWCALRGLEVTLQDREQRFIEPAMQRAAKLFSRKIHDANERAATGDRLVADVDGEGVARADLVIEAIFEDANAKRELYRKLGPTMKPGAIIATNTSSIRLEDLRRDVERPREFIGLHFFNPVAKLPLVEVIRCSDTEQAVLDRAFDFVKSIGKLPLECQSSPGFVVNRLLAPYMAEAMYLAAEGLPIGVIDKAAVDFGMPAGPIELIDTVGLDVAMHVSKILAAAYDREVPDILEELIAANRLGRKTGRGFYEWRDGKPVKPQVRGADGPPDLTDRMILPMINEAIACLADGIVRDADLLDAGVIFGTGFAPFRGGPLKYARDRGVDDIVGTLGRLAERYRDSNGQRFLPQPGWDEFDRQSPA